MERLSGNIVKGNKEQVFINERQGEKKRMLSSASVWWRGGGGGQKDEPGTSVAPKLQGGPEVLLSRVCPAPAGVTARPELS